MNPAARGFTEYAALRSCVRGIALFALCAFCPLRADRDVWAQPMPGADENLLAEDEEQQEAEPASEEPEPAPRELPRKAKKKPPAFKRPLRSLARQGLTEGEAPEQPGAVHVHLETPVPAALYDIGTGKVPSGTEPPHAQLVCHSPCDAQVDVSEGQVFAVWAPNMEMSESFTMRKDTRHAVVELEPPSSLVNDTGYVLFGIGGAFLVGAGSVVLYGLDHDGLSDSVLAGCGVTMAASAVLMLIGVPLATARRYPDVTLHEKPAGEAFAIDKRPEARAARPWLGEF